MISIGSTLTLELMYGDQKEKYKCRLVERENEYLYIDYPVNMETNKTMYLLEGTQLKCSFVGEDGAVYNFQTEILGRVKRNIPMLIMLYPGDEHLMKIQRRQYVRVEVAVDVAVHPIYSEFSPFVTYTDDISAGGAALAVSNKYTFNVGQRFITWFVLPMNNGQYHYLKIFAKVVRIVPLDSERNKVSIQFLDVDQNTRQILIRFCFDQQLRLKRKGLIG